jgi:hypothetical protein
METVFKGLLHGIGVALILPLWQAAIFNGGKT